MAKNDGGDVVSPRFGMDAVLMMSDIKQAVGGGGD
jgi:hypothetical protein